MLQWRYANADKLLAEIMDELLHKRPTSLSISHIDNQDGEKHALRNAREPVGLKQFEENSIADAYKVPAHRKPAPEPTREDKATNHAARMMKLMILGNVDSKGRTATDGTSATDSQLKIIARPDIPTFVTLLARLSAPTSSPAHQSLLRRSLIAMPSQQDELPMARLLSSSKFRNGENPHR